jgi:hypothetical protein
MFVLAAPALAAAWPDVPRASTPAGGARFDHAILGVPTLEPAMDWFARSSGVRPGLGGRHPGRGTRNALVGLGGGAYLELLAPDPDQAPTALANQLAALPTPRLVGWVAAVDDIRTAVHALHGRGIGTSEPTAGARERPDRRRLQWIAADIDAGDVPCDGVNVVPSLVEWQFGSVHPSEDSPAGCRLMRFTIAHPDPARLNRYLAAIASDVPVETAGTCRLVAELMSPNGTLTLG